MEYSGNIKMMTISYLVLTTKLMTMVYCGEYQKHCQYQNLTCTCNVSGIDVPEDIPNYTVTLTLNGLNEKNLPSLQRCRNLTHLKHVTLKGGDIWNLSNPVLGLENISKLSLSHMKNLISIDPRAFQVLEKLNEIEFISISMHINDIAKSFKHLNNRTMNTVTIDCNGPNLNYAEIMDKSTFQLFKHLHITNLTLTACAIAIVRAGYSCCLRNLKHLNLSYNFLSGDTGSIYEMIMLPNITVIDGSNQHVKTIPDNRINDEESEEADNNKNWPIIKLPKQLKYLYLHHMDAYIGRKSFHVTPENSLEFVDLSNNYLLEVLGASTGFHAIKYLNLQSNSLKKFSLDMFQDLSSIETLLLGNNRIGEIFVSDTDGKIFQNTSALKSLDLAKCSINGILPDKFMQRIQRLNFLNLSENTLNDLNISTMSKLNTLNISNNKFTRISDNFMNSVLKIVKRRNDSTKFILDLTNNPLTLDQSCCKVLQLIRWSKNSTMGLLLYSADQYKCIDQNKRKYFTDISITDLEQSCFPFLKVDVVFPVITVVITFVSIIFMVSIYRKRWCFREYFLAGKRYLRLQQQRKENTDGTVFRYDAFVAYHETDSMWIIDGLRRQLEEVHGLRLCLHQRDFLPGRAIEDNISNAIEVSRRVILVISPAFISSNWCLLEMRLARQSVIDRGYDILIPIILKKVDFTQTNMTLVNILKENTYMKWPERKENMQQLFWDRLYNVLKQGCSGLEN